MSREPALSFALRVAGQARPRLDLTLTLPPGVTVLFGPSGAGKTTCLHALAGIVRPSHGSIVLAGRRLFDAHANLDVPTHERRVALVFQSLALFPHLTVAQNVAFGVPRTLPTEERRALAQHWLSRMQVAAFSERHPGTLSGGEAQRVALARALASRPALLLLDEPFSALDHALRSALASEVVALVDELAIPAVLVTHDRDDARTLGRRVVTLADGRLAPPLTDTDA